jgi:hypothetical protein
MTTAAINPKRFATISDISTNPRDGDWGNGNAEIDRQNLVKFSTGETMDFTPGDSDLSGPPPQIGAKQAKNKGQTHDWPVPAARIGCQTYTGLKFGSHYIRFIFRRRGNNFTPWPDNR